MELVPEFMALLQGLSATMTAPTFASLTTVLTGWVFASRRTVTRMILAAGSAADKHFSSYHRLFSSARWSLDRLGLAVFDLIQPFLGNVVVLGLDDTLARKRGLKMFGTGMHHDPLLSSRGKVITNWGHSWVVLGVIVELPFRPGHYYCLPILFRLYLNKKSARKHRRAYRTRPELAVEMLKLLCNHRKNQRFHAIADSAYGGQSVLCHLPTNCDLTSRLVKDARLYGPRAPRKAGTNGRPRKRGERLPTPQAMLAGRCRRVTLDIYGRTEGARLADQVAYAHAAPERPLRVVAVEALQGGRGQEAFYSTCSDATAEQVIVLVRDALEHRSDEPRQQATPGVRGAARLDAAIGRAHGAAGHAAVQLDRAVVRAGRSSQLASAYLPLVHVENRTVVCRHAQHAPPA